MSATADNTTVQHGVKFAQAAGPALDAAQKLVTAIEKDAAECKPKNGQIVEKLAQQGLITADQRKQAAEQISTLNGMSDVLLNVIDMLGEKAAEHKKQSQKQANVRLGQPEAGAPVNGDLQHREKRASAITGYRRGQDDPLPDSDMALLRLVPGMFNRHGS